MSITILRGTVDNNLKYNRLKGFSLPGFDEPSMVASTLLSIYVFIWWLEIGKRVSFFGAIRFEFILGFILFVISVSRYLSNANRGPIINRVFFSVFLYLFVLLVSLPLASNITLASTAYLNFVLKYSLMGFFISQLVTTPKTLQLLLFSTFLAFLKIGQESFIGKISGNMVWYNQGIPRLWGTPGTMFGHPNELSGKIVASVPFLWYLFPIVKRNIFKILILLQAIFSLTVILYTGSRTGYIAFIVFILSVVAFGKNKLKVLMLIAIMLPVSMIYMPNDYKGRFVSSFTGKEKFGHSKEARVNLLRDSFYTFLENPLGVGLFCFPEVQRSAGRNPQETHNLYTQILSEAGLQGFICFWYMIWVSYSAISAAKKIASTNIDLLGQCSTICQNRLRDIIPYELSANKLLLAVANALIIFLIVRMALGLFGHDLLEIYWWLLAGLAVSLSEIANRLVLRVKEICMIAKIEPEFAS